MTIIDQSGDANLRDLHRFHKLYDLPDFAKQADFATEVCCKDDKPSLYADPRAVRQFPIHTKAAAFVSHIYYLEKSSELSPKVRPMIEARLWNAAQYWGIKNACLELRSKHAAMNKESHPDSCYAIVWANSSGQKERRYPLRNTGEVKAAAQWYCGYEDDIRSEFAFKDRATIASKILKQAELFGAGIKEEAPTLERACGRGLCDPVKVAAMLRNRVIAGLRVPQEVQENLLKLASVVETQASAFLDPATTADLAATVDEFDRNYHLLTKYSALIPNPESVIFEATYGETEKLAEENVTTLTGSVYNSMQFDKLSASDVRGLFGDDIATQVCSGLKINPEKMAELVETLPRPDAVMFDDLMANKGISPLAKEAQASTGFSFEALAKMAEAV